MGLLKPAENQTAYAKIGIMGFEGSGKTFTASEIAIGLTKLVKGSKCAFYSTEPGVDFMINKFKEADLELFTHKSRAFKDLIMVMREAEKEGYSTLIIDSISHVWRELMNSYLKSKSRTKMTMADQNIVKGQWQDYVDLYLNSKLHIIMCGRAGFEYEYQEDEDTGRQEFYKAGTKMKVEGETGYEPSLLLEMVKVRRSDALDDPKAKGFINRCIVLKDRSNLINGKEFDYPKFENFLPHIQYLNIGGSHLAVDTERSSVDMFGKDDWSYEERKKRRQIAIEELHDLLQKHGLGGASQDSKTKRVILLEETFGKSAQTFIENLPLPDLIEGVEKIRAHFAPPEPKLELEDSFDPKPQSAAEIA